MVLERKDKFGNQPHLRIKEQSKRRFERVEQLNQCHKINKLLGGGQSCSSCSGNNVTQEIEDYSFFSNLQDEIPEYKCVDDRQYNLGIQQFDVLHKEQTDDYNIYYQLKHQKKRLVSLIENLIIQPYYVLKEDLYKINLTKVNQMINVYLYYSLFQVGSQLAKQAEDREIEDTAKKLRVVKEHLKRYENQYPIQDLQLIMDFLLSVNSQRLISDEDKIQEIQKLHELTFECILKPDFTQHKESYLKDVMEREQSYTPEFKDANLEETKKFLKKISSNFRQASQGANAMSFYFSYFSPNFFMFFNILKLRKYDRFKEQFTTKNIAIEEQIIFYIDLLFDLKKQNIPDAMTYLLLQIFSLLTNEPDKIEAILKENKEIAQNLKQKIQGLVKVLKMDQEQCSECFSYHYLVDLYLQPTYRSLICQILLAVVDIEGVFDDAETKDSLIRNLCIKYYVEKLDSVKILFKSNQMITQYLQNLQLNSQKQEQIMREQQIVKNTMSKILNSYSVDSITADIQSFEDIDKLIVESLIRKQEMAIKFRQYNHTINHKDDNLLGDTHLYIKQSISFNTGNNLLGIQQNVNNNEIPIINEEINLNPRQLNNEQMDVQIQSKDAVEFIIKNYLIANYVHPSNKEEIYNQNGRCRILTILGSRGTGKSMLLKRLESQLMKQENVSKNNIDSANYLPILIKFNQLIEANPSIEDYLQEQNLNSKQINDLKISTRNKLIMLDGFDEFPGKLFKVFLKLRLNEWRNTLVIVTSRLEKTSLNEMEVYFRYYDQNGKEGIQNQFSIYSLNQFEKQDVEEYFKNFNNYLQTTGVQFMDRDIFKKMSDELKANESLLNIVKTPVSLHLISQLLFKIEVSKNKKARFLEIAIQNETDETKIYEYYFKVLFEKKAKEFISIHNLQQNEEVQRYIENQYFEYFQQLAMKIIAEYDKTGRDYQVFSTHKTIFENQFNLRKEIRKDNKSVLTDEQSIKLLDSIKRFNDFNVLVYVKIPNDNSGEILDSSKKFNNGRNEGKMDEESESAGDFDDDEECWNKEYKNNLEGQIEFRDTSLLEYFAARAMKSDFDVHQENIHNLHFQDLKKFQINTRILIDKSSNVKSLNQILIRLYKLILLNSKTAADITKKYESENIHENNRYIQYLKMSRINRSSSTSQIDVGSSNLLSLLYFSAHQFEKLKFTNCSFSRAHLVHEKAKVQFNSCNLEKAFKGTTKTIEAKNDTQNKEKTHFLQIQESLNISLIP